GRRAGRPDEHVSRALGVRGFADGIQPHVRRSRRHRSRYLLPRPHDRARECVGRDGDGRFCRLSFQPLQCRLHGDAICASLLADGGRAHRSGLACGMARRAARLDGVFYPDHDCRLAGPHAALVSLETTTDRTNERNLITGRNVMNIARLLARTAATYPALPALAYGKKIVANYREFADQAAGLAGALRGRLGLNPGDRVALIMKNHPEYWIALFAVWRAGLVAVPVNAKLHLNEFRYILENCGSRLVFATAELAAELAPLAKELPTLETILSVEDAAYQALNQEPALPLQDVDGDDLAWLFYTSGTTGKPKGAMLSHRNLLAATLSYFADVTSHDPGDCIIHAAPQTHGSGLYGLPLIAKGGIQVTPESGGFDPAETLGLIAHYPNSCFFFAPTMVHRLISSPAFDGADTRNLKVIVYGGGPMYEADIRRAIAALGPRFVQIYGQGESPM